MNDDDFRALMEQAHLLDELTQHPGWPVLVDFSHERMQSTKQAVLNGLVEDHTTYKNRTGWLRGIHDTLDAAATVAKMVDGERNRRAREQAPE